MLLTSFELLHFAAALGNGTEQRVSQGSAAIDIMIEGEILFKISVLHLRM